MNGQAIAALAVAGALAPGAQTGAADPATVGPDRLARVGGEARYPTAAADRAQILATRP